MTVRSKLALGLAAGALVIGSVSSAAARGYDGRWRGGHRGGDGIDAGAVFGLLLGVGVIAAIASANTKKKKEAEARADYDPRADNGSYSDRGYEDQRGYDGRAPNDRRYDDGRNNSAGASYAGEDEAVDACAVAAREEASRSGGFADIRGITGARAYGNGWDVTGTVDQRASYSSNNSSQRSFRCIYENGQVSGVTFGQAV